MITIINTPGNGEGSVFGSIIGIIVVIILVVLFFVYGLPAIRNSNAPAEQPNNSSIDVNVKLPGGSN